MGILATVAMRSMGTVFQSARTEETKQELEQIGFALAGNPELANNGTRTDFGYIGDVGSFPTTLDDLNQNPGGYSTWNGPYIRSDFIQVTNDYKQDAWGTNYSYGGGVDVTSTGSGSDIVYKIGRSSADFVINQVTGNVFDINGLPPGIALADSVSIELTIPDGSGSTVLKTTSPSAGGYFAFDSIPIGNHDIRVVYKPSDDTLDRFVSVLPQSSPHSTYLLDSAYFAGGGGSGGDLVYAAGSAQTQTGNCDRIEFDITNTTGSDIVVTSMTLSWAAPTAYYEKFKFDGGGHVFDENNPRAGSGYLANFSSSKIVLAGGTITIRVERFTDIISGNGSNVDMTDTDFTATFSDGSVVTFNSGACN